MSIDEKVDYYYNLLVEVRDIAPFSKEVLKRNDELNESVIKQYIRPLVINGNDRFLTKSFLYAILIPAYINDSMFPTGDIANSFIKMNTDSEKILIIKILSKYIIKLTDEFKKTSDPKYKKYGKIYRTVFESLRTDFEIELVKKYKEYHVILRKHTEIDGYKKVIEELMSYIFASAYYHNDLSIVDKLIDPYINEPLNVLKKLESNGFLVWNSKGYTSLLQSISLVEYVINNNIKTKKIIN